jgi:uncharacterized membrane protein YiaA
LDVAVLPSDAQSFSRYGQQAISSYESKKRGQRAAKSGLICVGHFDAGTASELSGIMLLLFAVTLFAQAIFDGFN